MSDYSQITDFSQKDSLTSGDAEKIILGADVDAELDAISTAIATKYDVNDLASQAQAQAAALNTVLMTPLRTADWSNANAGMVGDIWALTDTNADKILFWDDSAGAVAQLATSSNLTITGTTIDLSSSFTISGTATVGTLAATTITGAGSGITALNASNLASGTVPDARFPATLPALNGSALTNLTAANVTGSHTLPDSVLSTNIPLLDAASNLFGTGAKNEFVLTPMIGISAAGSGAYYVARDTTNDVEAFWGADNTSGMPIGTVTNHAFTLRTNNSNRFVINGSGNFDFKGGTVTTNNASASEVGFKGMPIKTWASASDDPVLADANKAINITASGTVTIPANGSVAFPVGTVLTFIGLYSGGSNTIAITTDTMYLAGTLAATTGSRTLAYGGIATAVKFSSTQWLISGTGLS